MLYTRLWNWTVLSFLCSLVDEPKVRPSASFNSVLTYHTPMNPPKDSAIQLGDDPMHGPHSIELPIPLQWWVRLQPLSHGEWNIAVWCKHWHKIQQCPFTFDSISRLTKWHLEWIRCLTSQFWKIFLVHFSKHTLRNTPRTTLTLVQVNVWEHRETQHPYPAGQTSALVQNDVHLSLALLQVNDQVWQSRKCCCVCWLLSRCWDSLRYAVEHAILWKNQRPSWRRWPWGFASLRCCGGGKGEGMKPSPKCSWWKHVRSSNFPCGLGWIFDKLFVPKSNAWQTNMVPEVWFPQTMAAVPRFWSQQTTCHSGCSEQCAQLGGGLMHSSFQTQTWPPSGHMVDYSLGHDLGLLHLDLDVKEKA